VAIQNSKKIWENHFKDRPRVNLIEFLVKFYEDYDIKPYPIENVKDDVTYKCLRLVMDMKNEITKDDVDRFITLFTPLESKAHLIISKVKDLLERPYFWGYMTDNDAANLLKKTSKHNNTYLIRYSANSANFVVAFTTNKGKEVNQYRFTYKDFDRVMDILDKKGFRTPSTSKNRDIKQYPFSELFKKTDSKISNELAKPEHQHVFNMYVEYYAKASGLRTVQEKLDKNTKKKVY